MFSCECTARAYMSVEECTDSVTGWFAEMLETMDRHGARFQPACFEDMLAAWDTDAVCRSPHEAPSIRQCELFVGNTGAGGSCEGAYTTPFSADNCSPGLTCFEGRLCARPEHTWPELVEGQPCGVGGRCVTGLYCDPLQSACVREVGLGEPCNVVAACEYGAYCSGVDAGEGTCVPLLPLGGACDPSDNQPCEPTCSDGGCRYNSCIAGTCAAMQPVACGVGPFPPY